MKKDKEHSTREIKINEKAISKLEVLAGLLMIIGLLLTRFGGL